MLKEHNKKNVISSETTREGINSEQKWAVGLIDGDGHIGLEWTNKEKTKWVPVLKVTLHRYNSRAVYKLKKILGIGKITYSGSTITYRVRSKALWHSVLIPLFSKFHLRSMKYAAVLVIQKALHMSQVSNSGPVLKLGQSLNRKTDQISPIWANGTSLQKILDLDWLAGFIEAEGSFYILSHGQHGFAIGQAYDQHIIIGIYKLFSVQSALKNSNNNNYIMLDTKNTEALFLIANAINGRLLGIKSFEFSLWLRTLRKKKKLKL